ncbi:hypothetical protein V8E36_000814 [Tilletia maclaganii]
MIFGPVRLLPPRLPLSFSDSALPLLKQLYTARHHVRQSAQRPAIFSGYKTTTIRASPITQTVTAAATTKTLTVTSTSIAISVPSTTSTAPEVTPTSTKFEISTSTAFSTQTQTVFDVEPPAPTIVGDTKRDGGHIGDVRRGAIGNVDRRGPIPVSDHSKRHYEAVTTVNAKTTITADTVTFTTTPTATSTFTTTSTGTVVATEDPVRRLSKMCGNAQETSQELQSFGRAESQTITWLMEASSLVLCCDAAASQVGAVAYLYDTSNAALPACAAFVITDATSNPEQCSFSNDPAYALSTAGSGLGVRQGLLQCGAGFRTPE